jgi:hypothetical protein
MEANDVARESMDFYNYTALVAPAEKVKLIDLKMKMEERDASKDEYDHVIKWPHSEIC